MNTIAEINRVFQCEIEALEKMKASIGNEFNIFVDEIAHCKGRIITTGMGKSGHICRKISATMQSLGIKSYFMHPAEGLHGDLGLLTTNDLVIAVSNGGETDELLSILPTIKHIGAKVFCIVGRSGSTLQKYSDASIIIPPIEEAYLNQLVPTSSTTVTLVIGDALAVAVAKIHGFTASDFGIFHPNGLIGKRLTLRIESLMLKKSEFSTLSLDSTVNDAVFEMCKNSIGGVCIINQFGELQGVFTDGDLRRLCGQVKSDPMKIPIQQVMSDNPITFSSKMLVTEAISTMNSKGKLVSFFPIVDEGCLVGVLRLLDITKSGLLG